MYLQLIRQDLKRGYGAPVLWDDVLTIPGAASVLEKVLERER